VASDPTTQRQLAVPPDLALCEDCAREIEDPDDRRYGYAFTNCTNCGPRFTIVRRVPYDREATSMAEFALCAGCRSEYEDPQSRRFHAEPNACASCGPALRVLDANGAAVDFDDPVSAMAKELRCGATVAVKGVGGFHLACDATSSSAVQRLRTRKRREQKPLAVMVRDLAEARRLAFIDDLEEALLCSPERPIVLLRRRADTPLAAEVVLEESPLLGLFLPYSPLHQLLVTQADRPLVMTSGNLSDEPLAHDNHVAVERLTGITDWFLVHDRAIETPCDDSVARVIASTPVVLRRARGWVPRPVRLGRRFRRPVLAMGGDLKNAFCLGVGDCAYLGPHIGDLEGLETYEHLTRSIEHMQGLLDITPEVVAHDLHPGYFSTRHALERACAERVPVQHHHAHVVSCMAEHGVTEPVLGVAFDGTGYGTDGAAWGGEVLIANYGQFDRVATLRPLRLAGGDQAIRQPWRTALAALEDAFETRAPIDRLSLFDSIPRAHIEVVQHMIRGGVHAPLAHGCGRWFDAVGALVLAQRESHYDAQVAMSLNLVADDQELQSYPFALDVTRIPWELDLRPALRAVVSDLLADCPPSIISARFHNALAEGTARLVRLAARYHGEHPVVLSGGCFQNARLAESVCRALRPELEVLLHSQVPPGDGGLALGQALIADAVSWG